MSSPFGERLGVGLPLPWRKGDQAKEAELRARNKRGMDAVPPMSFMGQRTSCLLAKVVQPDGWCVGSRADLCGSHGPGFLPSGFGLGPTKGETHRRCREGQE